MNTAHIRPLLEDAFRAYLAAGRALEVPVYLTADVLARGESAVPPFVTVLARSATPTVPEVGIEHIAAADRNIEVTISVITQANDNHDPTSDAVTQTGRDYHNTLVSAVMDLLFVANILTAINAVADGVLVQNLDYVSDSTEPQEATFRTDITMTANCIGVQT